ncbi:hypothetical protein HG535_0C04180 [Zygotorulaspora mrakii]|uniref:FHA domain-containing protein n=1 Tax=Zygotorulaspora mrakii TaxID=42260 RepID=A0A7H9B107_ZYGMR|nr:uncharacterized protein HG535_0C04180 [Zygotorulaspora mrakii]QLG72064.1 hypothetical protein HG535_0C04180 [Zygotorulaspora mrakii]
MWILRYQYELDGGNLNSVSFCINSEQINSIGRSSKNNLVIRNDKSISREHLRFSWKRNESSLNFTNKGKLTAANGKYLKPDETISFEESLYHSLPIVIELGTKPTRIEVRRQEEVWDIPSDLSNFEPVLKISGIDVISNRKRENTCNLMVASNNVILNRLRHLFALINGIKFVNSEFLTRASTILCQKQDNFDDLWSDLRDPKYLMYSDTPAHKKHVSLLGLKFYVLGGDSEEIDLARSSIEAVGGSVSTCDIAYLEHALQHERSKESIIIIQLSGETSLPTNIEGRTIDQLINAFSKEDVESLLGGISESDSVLKSATLSPTQNNDAQQLSLNDKSSILPMRPLKRRRVTRQTIKPLDSLMFFAGGDSIVDDSIKNDSQKQISQIPELLNRKSSQIEIPAAEQALTMSEKQPETSCSTHSSVIEESTKRKRDESSNNKQCEDALQDKRVHTFAVAIGTHENPDLTIAKRGKKSLNTHTLPKNTRKKTLTDYKIDSNKSGEDETKQDPQDLVQVIQDTKNREVNRLRSTLVQVSADELTDDAIMKLGNITLVERNDSLYRHDSSKQVSGDKAEKQAFEGRKNFKVFTKSWPAYQQKQLGSSVSQASSNSVRNSAFLISRKYVPLKEYSKDSEGTNDQEFNDFVDPHVHAEKESSSHSYIVENGDQRSFSFSRNSSASNALFVADEDEDPVIPLVQPEKDIPRSSSRSRSRSKSISGHALPQSKSNMRSRFEMDGDSDDDSDDDGPKFSFKRSRR